MSRNYRFKGVGYTPPPEQEGEFYIHVRLHKMGHREAKAALLKGNLAIREVSLLVLNREGQEALEKIAESGKKVGLINVQQKLIIGKL